VLTNRVMNVWALAAPAFLLAAVYLPFLCSDCILRVCDWPRLRRGGLDLPVLIDQYGSGMRAYAEHGLPTSFLVDDNGPQWGACRVGVRGRMPRSTPTLANSWRTLDEVTSHRL
jgi:hypothetical protein